MNWNVIRWTKLPAGIYQLQKLESQLAMTVKELKNTSLFGVNSKRLRSSTFFLNKVICMYLVWPPDSNSDHQDYYMFSRESSFATVTGRGPPPMYV